AAPGRRPGPARPAGGAAGRREGAPSSVVGALQGALDLALGVARGGVAALVVQLLAAGDGDVELRPAVLEVEPQGHDRQPAAAHGALQLGDLAALQQELPGTLRLVVVVAGVLVRRDVHALDEHLAVPDGGERPGDRAAALPQRLDLAARQLEAGRVPLEELELV